MKLRTPDQRDLFEQVNDFIFIYDLLLLFFFLNFMNRIKGLMVVELLTMSAGEIRDFFLFRFYKKLEKTWVLIMIPWCKNLLF